MKRRTTLIGTCLLAALMASSPHAQEDQLLGQTLQITTRLHSFVGRPIWTLIIRDVDSGIVYPYLYDFSQTQNHWLAFTYGKNYLQLFG